MAVVGARPNFVKLAPLIAAAARRGRRLAWIHTGQHEDARLTRALWRDLRLPAPAEITTHERPGPKRAERMARRLLAPLAALRPALVAVVGDVDSTVAGALAAKRLRLPLAHVEAGLRCGDRRMPEERNRVRVDRLSDLLHASEPSAARALRDEGFPRAAIHLAGNVMADALAGARERLRFPKREGLWRLRGTPFGVITLHRAANVDDVRRLVPMLGALTTVAHEVPLVLPVHPRTEKWMGENRRELRKQGLRLVSPLGYLEFLGLVAQARVVLTDSGGLPLECSLLGVPCITLRSRYEHTLTLTHGTNRLAGADPRRIPGVVRAALAAPRTPRPLPPAWDGHAAERIVARWERMSV